VKVLRAVPVEARGDPGAVVEASNRRLAVATGRGAVALEDVVPEGRKRMSGPDFARGQRPHVGDRFG
jgi:methionyl-tRNA formyltransferase